MAAAEAAAAAAEDAEAAAKSTRAVKLAFFGIYGSESGTEGEAKSPGVMFLRPPPPPPRQPQANSSPSTSRPQGSSRCR